MQRSSPSLSLTLPLISLFRFDHVGLLLNAAPLNAALLEPSSLSDPRELVSFSLIDMKAALARIVTGGGGGGADRDAEAGAAGNSSSSQQRLANAQRAISDPVRSSPLVDLRAVARMRAARGGCTRERSEKEGARACAQTSRKAQRSRKKRAGENFSVLDRPPP